MSLKLNTASGGSITLQEADTASNLTLTVPAQAGTVVASDASGNVGIGVTPSAWYATSTKALQMPSGSLQAFQTNFLVLKQNAFANTSGADTYVNNGWASQYQQDTGTHKWYTAPSGTAGNAITFTTAMEVDASSNLKFNSGYGSVATAYGCRAWVNFNGTGTVAIRASGNVSSITDNGTGTYVVNFTNAMPDANYSWSGSATATSGSNMLMGNNSPVAPTASALAIMAVNAGIALIDPPYVCVEVFR